MDPTWPIWIQVLALVAYMLGPGIYSGSGWEGELEEKALLGSVFLLSHV